MIKKEIGIWSENAERLIPRGEVSWLKGVLGFSGTVQNKAVVILHKKPGKQWLLRIEGWQWHVTDEMGIARFNQIPGDKIKLTPVKNFTSLVKAKKEAESILSKK